MLVNPNDVHIGESLCTYGEFSPEEGNLYRSLVGAGDVIVEAGANIGCFTLLFARLVGEAGRVHAFEPQRLLFQTLCANLALNGMTNVEAWPAGIGAEIGQMFVPPVDYATPGNFGALELADGGPGECVPITTIDNLRLESCALIKADVQGMELAVLRGGRDTISRCRPLLYVENDQRLKSPALLTEIDELGYRAYWHLPRYFDSDNYRGVAENIFPGIVNVNLLCLPCEASTHPPPGVTRVAGPEDWWLKS